MNPGNARTERLLGRIREFIPLGEGNKKILHLCCQDAHIDGAINIDYVKFEGVDIIADLNRRWRFAKNESVDGIIAIDALEHLNYFHAMGEIARVLKPGGNCYLRVPHFTNHRAHIGEHTIPGLSYIAFDHFKDKNHPFYRLKVISNRISFGRALRFLDWAINRMPLLWERFFCYIMPAVELEIVLEKR